MSKTGIFYASKGGVTETFAKQIAEKLGADLHNMKDAAVDVITGYQNVVVMSWSFNGRLGRQGKAASYH